MAGNTDFADVETFPEPYAEHTVLHFAKRKYWLAKYDTDLLSPLRDSGVVRVKNFENWVRRWQPPGDLKRLRCDTWFMSQFYFMANSAQRLENAKRHVGRILSDTLPDGLLDWVLLGQSPSEAGFREVSRFSFDRQESSWQIVGKAFADYPTSEQVTGQDPVFGHEGPFINSFTEEDGDEALGKLVSAPFRLEGDAITLKVGGGMHETRLSVQLKIDGRQVAAITGCNSELMYRWAWDIARYRGKQARLEIADLATGGWGHLLLDEVIQWRRVGVPAKGRGSVSSRRREASSP